MHRHGLRDGVSVEILTCRTKNEFHHQKKAVTGFPGRPGNSLHWFLNTSGNSSVTCATPWKALYWILPGVARRFCGKREELLPLQVDPEEKSIYVHTLEYPIQLDGYTHDWSANLDWAQVLRG